MLKKKKKNPSPYPQILYKVLHSHLPVQLGGFDQAYTVSAGLADLAIPDQNSIPNIAVMKTRVPGSIYVS